MSTKKKQVSHEPFNIDHWNWCMENRIKVYVKTSKSTYGTTVLENGRKKSKQLPYVNICVSLDGNNKRFNEEYRQDDEELSSIINKLYKYYYERSNA